MNPRIKEKIEHKFGKLAQIVQIGTGSNYDVFRFVAAGKTYVLRVQKRAVYDFSQYEAQVLQSLSGLYAPEFFCLDEDAVSQEKFMVIAYVDGEIRETLSLDDVILVVDRVKEIHQRFTQAGQFPVARDYFQKIYQEKFGQGIDVMDRSDWLEKSKFPEFLSVVRQLIASTSEVQVQKECLIHGDLNHTNILWCNGEPRFIDWELSRYTIPEFEFGGICYCHGKSVEMLKSILGLFDNDPLVLTSLALRTADSIFWRIKWLLEVELIEEDFQQQRRYFDLDLQKMNFVLGLS